MSLTSAQYLVLKNAINANPTWAAFPTDTDGCFGLAAALSQQAVPNFWVWNTRADLNVVKSAIINKNMTPLDAPNGTLDWLCRSAACQGKQFSLQLILPQQANFNSTINASDANFRAGLKDALTNLPSGAAGALLDAGWTGVQAALSRRATYAEAILADTSSANGGAKANSANLVLDGFIDPSDVQIARAS